MRMLSKFVVAAVLGGAVAAMPARAEDIEKQSFTHQGFTYVYKVTETADGRKIAGRRYPDAVPFSLGVKNGKVSGVSGGQFVSFQVADAAGATSAN